MKNADRLVPFAAGAVLGALVMFGLSFLRSSTEPTHKAGNVAQPLAGQDAKDLKLVIAKVDGRSILLGELQWRINAQPFGARARYRDPVKLREYLQNHIRFDLQFAEARRRGIDTDATIERQVAQLAVQRLIRNIEVETAAQPIGEDDVAEYYKAHLTEYAVQEQVRVSVIALDDNKVAGEVHKLSLAADEQGFRELVAAHSVDERSKGRHGDLGHLLADSKELPELALAAAFRLSKRGDISDVVAVNDRFYIVRLTGRRPGKITTIEAARGRIRATLLRQQASSAVAAFIDKLEADASIEIDDANLSKLQVAESSSS